MKWLKKNIEHAKVQADIDTGAPSEFNTSFHNKEEAPDLDFPAGPPYSYERWLRLILRSRGLPPSAVQKVTFTPAQARLLLEACKGSIPTGRINLMLAEDLESEIAPVLSQLSFPPEGLFARLDACSPKDGTHSNPAQPAIHSVDEIILRVVTSGRCRSAINGCLSAGKPVELFFLPFDGRMASEKEYRVFCRTNDCRLTGISQYKWHKPWLYADRPEAEQNAIISQICYEAMKLRQEILAELGDSENDQLVLKQGMSFDLLFIEETQTVELVELNSFGVQSPCGSCLFQWVKDRRQLYDEGDRDTLEFRYST